MDTNTFKDLLASAPSGSGITIQCVPNDVFSYDSERMSVRDGCIVKHVPSRNGLEEYVWQDRFTDPGTNREHTLHIPLASITAIRIFPPYKAQQTAQEDEVSVGVTHSLPSGRTLRGLYYSVTSTKTKRVSYYNKFINKIKEIFND